MKKKALALSVLAAVSSQAGAFQFDTGDDWDIRWDNTFKGNLASRVFEASDTVVKPGQGTGQTLGLTDDSDYSKNRKAGGIVSSRIDLVSELDVIWRDDWGFRVSGAGWYDAAYEDSDNPSKGTLPNGRDYYSSWGALSVKPGHYTDAAKDLHYAGGELLDAFVFGNWNLPGDMVFNIRAGRHTLYWGQSLLGTGAIVGIAGSMAALDFAKAFTVPGTEAKELFMPNNKISSILQITDNLTLSGFYAFEHVVNRFPEEGSFLSPAELLTEDSEFLTFSPGTATTRRQGFMVRDDKYSDSGEFGFNIQYTIEPWQLETSLVYISATDRNVSGLYGAINPAGVSPEDQAKALAGNATAIGYYGWVYKNEIDTYGLSLSKQMFDISFGMDVVYREDAPINPGLAASLTQRPGTSPADWNDGDNYPGAIGDVYTVVVNGLGLMNGDWGLWDGGSWILEFTGAYLDQFTGNEKFANPIIHEGRWVTGVGVSWKPTWYQVFPGWDLSLPVAVGYTIDGEQSPISNGGNEEIGNGSAGVEFNVNELWTLTARYNTFFGPVNNGTAGFIRDRDNVSLTVKRTF